MLVTINHTLLYVMGYFASSKLHLCTILSLEIYKMMASTGHNMSGLLIFDRLLPRTAFTECITNTVGIEGVISVRVMLNFV